MFHSKFLIVPICSLFLLLAACGPMGDEHGSGGGADPNLGGGIGGSGDGDGASGELQVALVGREAPAFQALEIELAGIDLHRTGTADEQGGWVELEAYTVVLDVLQLIDGQEQVLVDTLLDAGNYDKLRARVASATLSLMGSTHSMLLASNGAEIEHPTFGIAVDRDGLAQVTLDFDPLASVQSLGGGMFKLMPTLSIVIPEYLGSISGTVAPLGPLAVVSAYRVPSGHLVASAQVRTDGAYLLPRLAVRDSAGNPMRYDLHASAPGYDSPQSYLNVPIAGGTEATGYDFDLQPQ